MICQPGYLKTRRRYLSGHSVILENARYDPDSASDLRTLKEARSTARDQHARSRWWEPYWPRPEMRRQIERLPRYIVTTETSEYRLFVWLRFPVLPDKNLIVIARDDDTTFGILHSRFHEAWALRLGTSLEDRPRYTSTTTFATYPFPAGLIPNRSPELYASDPRAIAIAAAARRLDELRTNWLNPDGAAAEVLRDRTLTALYNERPTWLRRAHRVLDEAVAIAYGWPADISDDDALARLLAINETRVEEQRAAPRRRPPTPEQLRREPELPPLSVPGGRADEEPEQEAARPARRRARGRREAS